MSAEIERLTHDCHDDSRNRYALGVMKGLTLGGPDWEPKDDGKAKGRGWKWMHETCDHARHRYVDLALSLMGDKPAGSLTFDEIVNAALYQYEIEIRNVVRHHFTEWGIFEKEGEL